jgi:hypothetical protein
MFHGRKDRLACLPIISNWGPEDSAGELQTSSGFNIERPDPFGRVPVLTSNALTPFGRVTATDSTIGRIGDRAERGGQKFNGTDSPGLIATISTRQSGIPDAPRRKTPRRERDFFRSLTSKSP